MDALLNKNPFEILAYQYDMVCNGVELASGAVRNHKPEIMYKAFELAGYDHSVVDNKFGGMINAFKYGARRTQDALRGLTARSCCFWTNRLSATSSCSR